jgi:hypothetical protein
VGSFLRLLERRDGVWRVVKRTAAYEKKIRMEPVDPQGVPLQAGAFKYGKQAGLWKR